MSISLRDVLVAADDIGRSLSRKAGNTARGKRAPPASHANLGWREAPGSDTRESNNSRTTIGEKP
jgi:hypothetical protein